MHVPDSSIVHIYVTIGKHSAYRTICKLHAIKHLLRSERTPAFGFSISFCRISVVFVSVPPPPGPVRYLSSTQQQLLKNIVTATRPVSAASAQDSATTLDLAFFISLLFQTGTFSHLSIFCTLVYTQDAYLYTHRRAFHAQSITQAATFLSYNKQEKRT